METSNSEIRMEAGSCKRDEVEFRDARSSQRPLYGREGVNNAKVLNLRLPPISVHTGSGDREGHLVLADGRLVAVLVRLDDQAHAGLVGAWFLEAGFGPCARAAAPVFGNLDAAQEWVRAQIGYAATTGAARRGMCAVSGKQAGDLVRAVDAIVEAVESASPPHRVPLGNDAADGPMAKLGDLRGEFAAWEVVSRGADLPKDEEEHTA